MVVRRSGCPINVAVEVLGDRWSLLVIRDMVFGENRHFREILHGSQEGIATNVLADRLKRLTEQGLLTRRPDPAHRQKAIYSLTEVAIELVPVLAHLGAWGRRHFPVTDELAVRARLLEEGGPALWDDFMAELRERPSASHAQPVPRRSPRNSRPPTKRPARPQSPPHPPQPPLAEP